MRRLFAICVVLVGLAGPSLGARAQLNVTSAHLSARKRLRRVKRCYRRSLRVHEDKYGAIRLSFRVSGSGRVTDRWISLSTVSDVDLDSCVLGAFKNIKFAAPDDGNERVVSVAILMTTDSTSQDVVRDAKQSLLGRKRK